VTGSVGQYLALVLYALPGLVIGFVVHELAHAFVAVRLGDPTPRRLGRITANPRQHIDPVGLGMLLTIGFGWAKPVTFSTAYIRTGAQQAMVAASGPLSNLVLAAVFAGLLHLELALSPDAALHVLQGLTPDGRVSFGHGGPDAILYWFLNEAFFVNVVLFVFNSIPIPGLDGYAVVRGLFGRAAPHLFHTIEANRQIIWALALVVLFVLPTMSSGGTNPLASIIDSTDNFLYRTFVDPGGTALPAGLPNITLLFNG
jgi:Zn-dependent protease